ncbi:MAG: hypothetical protein AAF682_11940 [Planctomycetota bacterium]
MHRHAQRLRLVLPLAVALGLGACASSQKVDEVVQLIQDERYAEAVSVAAERAADDPEDERAARLHREASIAFILNQGRRAVFDREFEDALTHFNQALEIDPDNETTHVWIRKTLDQLTETWLRAGLEFIVRDELPKAEEAYELALYYSPGHPEAVLGIGRVQLLMNYRRGLGESYYSEGVRAVYKHLYVTARSRFGYTEKYIPGDERAALRKEKVESALAEERMFVAQGFEQEGLYGAAMGEYKLVLTLEPENEQAKAGFERMRAEEEASRALTAADLLIRQGRLEEAMLKLQEGRELTELQADDFTWLVNQVESTQWAALFEEALALEQDYRYEEAVEVYNQLAEASDSSDAMNRRDTLLDYIDQASKLYASLDAAAPDEQLGILREIEILWPEYRDIQFRIAELAGGE